MELRRETAPVAASVTVETDREQHRRYLRGTRNGLPGTVPYVYRARRQPWAQRAVAASIAEYGEPRLRRVHSGRYDLAD